MNYQKIVCPNYNIHLIQDNRFHSIILKVFFTENVSLERITYRNCLINLLTYATKNYDTKQKIICKAQDLYSTYPDATVSRFGNLLVTKFMISTISSQYLNQDNIKDNLLLLKEILLNPLVNNQEFNQEYLKIVKANQEAEFKVVQEDPRFYANIQLLNMVEPDKSKNYNLTGYCDLKIIKKMTARSLYNSYCEMLRKSKIDFFVAGDIKFSQEIIDFIKKNFIFNSKPKLVNPVVYHERVKDIIIKKERKDYFQSKLSIGVKAYDLNSDESKYLFSFLGILLGGYGDSLLMNNVRDKNSLAYYASCYYNKLDNFLVINSGINKDNYEKVLETIKRTIEEIRIGKFTKTKLEECKLIYISQLEEINENNNSLIEYYFGREVFKTDELSKRIERIKKITKEDIMTVAKKMEIVAVYFLEGDL